MGSFRKVSSQANTPKPSAFLFECMGAEGRGMRAAPDLYAVTQLNVRAENSWAVVEIPSGAIALDRAGRLLMRLGQQEAEAVAATLTRRLLLLLGARGMGRSKARGELV